MHNPNLRGAHRAPRRNAAAMIALGAAVPVFAVAYFLLPAGTERAAPAADTQRAASWTSAGTPSVTPVDTPAAVSAGAQAGDGASAQAGDGASAQAGDGASAQAGDGASAPAGDGTGTSPGAGGWGRGGYPMMDVPGSQDANGADGAGAAVTAAVSQNWAGYVATGPANSFGRVSASWAQPAVNCGAENTFSSFWVGLDGDGTPTVEQTGTEADCVNGAAAYQGWYEIFPNAPVFFPDPVQPGDAMSASVVAGGNGTFTLTLSDGTRGWTQTTQQVEAAAQLGSAEVIAEAPSDGTVLPLADFGTANFTGAMVNGAAIGGSGNLSELTMESAAGDVLATPSPLAGAAAAAGLTGGSAFSVTSAPGGGALTPWDNGDQG